MTKKEVTEIANKLTTNDVCDLLNIFAHKIMVHDQTNNYLLEIDTENPPCINGSNIQINFK
jgi:hypothetical protein